MPPVHSLKLTNLPPEVLGYVLQFVNERNIPSLASTSKAFSISIPVSNRRMSLVAKKSKEDSRNIVRAVERRVFNGKRLHNHPLKNIALDVAFRDFFKESVWLTPYSVSDFEGQSLSIPRMALFAFVVEHIRLPDLRCLNFYGIHAPAMSSPIYEKEVKVFQNIFLGLSHHSVQLKEVIFWPGFFSSDTLHLLYLKRIMKIFGKAICKLRHLQCIWIDMGFLQPIHQRELLTAFFLGSETYNAIFNNLECNIRNIKIKIGNKNYQPLLPLMEDFYEIDLVPFDNIMN